MPLGEVMGLVESEDYSDGLDLCGADAVIRCGGKPYKSLRR